MQFYLYIDEAHSIGALGERGGGVCDFYGKDSPSNQQSVASRVLTHCYQL
jgi:7-keto-8-aminopelargonate synthetase-like enzyme